MTLPYFGDTLRLRALTASEAMLACVLAMSAPFVLLHPAIRPSPLQRDDRGHRVVDRRGIDVQSLVRRFRHGRARCHVAIDPGEADAHRGGCRGDA